MITVISTVIAILIVVILVIFLTWLAKRNEEYPEMFLCWFITIAGVISCIMAMSMIIADIIQSINK